MTSLRIVVLILLGPVLSLWLVDRALVGSTPLWSWVAREMPRRIADPFLVESTLRAVEPGRHNVIVLGNSRADDGIHTAVLETELERPGLRVRNLTVAGTSLLQHAMSAPELAELEASLALLVTDAVALADPDPAERIWDYDLGVALDVFAPGEIARDPLFHLRGLIQQSHVLARHRRALQHSAMVGAGYRSWDDVMEEQLRQEDQAPAQNALWHQWLRGELLPQFPGPGTRAIRALDERLRERGTRLVLVESPEHPLIPMTIARRRAVTFREDMQAFAAAQGIPFISAESFETLEARDFLDMIHLTPRGSERFTRDLARAIAPLLDTDS